MALNFAEPVRGANASAMLMLTSKVIDRLRAATSTHHRAIDTLMCMEGEFSVEHYGHALQGFEQFLTQWEPLVTQALPAPLQHWAQGLRRLAVAQRDMAILGLPSLPSVTLDLLLPDKAAALGSMYVLEGSTLGGVVIARHLRRQHGIEAHNGAAYFSGWGAATSANWQRFRQILEAQVGTNEASRERAVAAAVDTFNVLNLTMRRAFHADTHS